MVCTHLFPSVLQLAHSNKKLGVWRYKQSIQLKLFLADRSTFSMVYVIFLPRTFWQIIEPQDAKWHNLNEHFALLLQGFTLSKANNMCFYSNNCDK